MEEEYENIESILSELNKIQYHKMKKKYNFDFEIEQPLQEEEEGLNRFEWEKERYPKDKISPTFEFNSLVGVGHSTHDKINRKRSFDGEQEEEEEKQKQKKIIQKGSSNKDQ